MTMRLPSLEPFDGHSLGKASHDISFPAHLPMGLVTSVNECLRNLVQLLFPATVYLRSTHMLSARVHRVYQLKLSNEHQLLVKISPLPAVPLLRRERVSLETEARALTLLARIREPCIPKLFRYVPHDSSSSLSFLVRQYVHGTPLADIQDELSLSDCRNLDRHLGSLMRLISQQESTTFGSLIKVAAGAGSHHWRESFTSLFEEVLRDAEDMYIHLPYDQIRMEISRLAPVLDEITVPRLVIINFGRPSEVLLDPELKRLSAITNLAGAFWGDVLLAEIFESPSEAFLDGFGLNPSRGRPQFLRSLLYSCYRHVYNITELYYRNSNDANEMHARRKLTKVLQTMSATK